MSAATHALSLSLSFSLSLYNLSHETNQRACSTKKVSECLCVCVEISACDFTRAYAVS